MSIARRRRFRNADSPFGMLQNAAKCYHLFAPHRRQLSWDVVWNQMLVGSSYQVAPPVTDAYNVNGPTLRDTFAVRALLKGDTAGRRVETAMP